MMRVKFNRAFDYQVPGKHAVTIAYEAGRTYRLPKAHGEAAIAAGAADEAEEPGASDG